MKLCMSCGSPVMASSDVCPTCGAQLINHSNSLIGTILAGKYRIEARLGAGGMCEVYRARHVLIGKQVAVKVLKRELAADPKIAERFEQEARAASRVRHPNAIDVTDFGVAGDNMPFIVMELVEGMTLSELLRREGPMPVERAANILRQVCGALEVAHGVGVIHRDIKPDNILIAEYEGGDWVEVVDFGVAKIQEDVNRRAALTGANFIIGTPRYMSPEQCEERPVDARSDIYSLGVVLYEMLSGEAPFEGNSTRLLIAHSVEPPVPLRQKIPDLPAEVENVVMSALEKEPDRRPHSAAELAREFAIAAGLVQGMEVEQGRSGALPRMMAPPISADAGLDEEATMVRGRAAARSDQTQSDETATVTSGPRPYNTNPELPAPPVRPAHRRANSGVVREDRHGRRPLMIGLAAALVITFLIAYFASSNKQRPADKAVEQVAAAEPVASPEPRRQEPAQVSPAADTASQPTPAADQQAAAQTEEIPNEVARVDTGRARTQVIETMNSWVQSLEARNLNEHISHYAPRLHTYYLARGVNRGYVRSDRARALSTFEKLDFDVSNIEVRVDPSGKRAIATYDKRWSFQGESPWSGTVRERLWLENNSGRWRITGERDLKVY